MVKVVALALAVVVVAVACLTANHALKSTNLIGTSKVAQAAGEKKVLAAAGEHIQKTADVQRMNEEIKALLTKHVRELRRTKARGGKGRRGGSTLITSSSPLDTGANRAGNS